MKPQTRELLTQTAEFDDIIVKFTDRCFAILENLSREQIRDDIDITEISWNDEESTAFISATVTFNKLVTRLCHKNFISLFEKMKVYAKTHVLEPAMGGPMFSSMVQGLAVVQPDKTLDFFIPHLCSKLETILLDQSLYSKVITYYNFICIISDLIVS